MKTDELEARFVNGGLVFLPNIEQWMSLLRDQTLDGQPIVAIDVVQGNLRFSREHTAILPALHRPSTFTGWMPITILEARGLIQRVQIENGKCDKCLWQGVIATPTVLPLYFGTPSPRQEYESSFKITPVLCPNCKAQIKGHPIWLANA